MNVTWKEDTTLSLFTDRIIVCLLSEIDSRIAFPIQLFLRKCFTIIKSKCNGKETVWINLCLKPPLKGPENKCVERSRETDLWYFHRVIMRNTFRGTRWNSASFLNAKQLQRKYIVNKSSVVKKHYNWYPSLFKCCWWDYPTNWKVPL